MDYGLSAYQDLAAGLLLSRRGKNTTSVRRRRRKAL